MTAGNFQHASSPEPQRGPQVECSVLGKQEGGGRRGDGPERQTTSEGHLVNSGNQESSESALGETSRVTPAQVNTSTL